MCSMRGEICRLLLLLTLEVKVFFCDLDIRMVSLGICVGRYLVQLKECNFAWRRLRRLDSLEQEGFSSNLNLLF
jgi:hypothetical protein